MSTEGKGGREEGEEEEKWEE